jgi:hypothetical protein
MKKRKKEKKELGQDFFLLFFSGIYPSYLQEEAGINDLSHPI